MPRDLYDDLLGIDEIDMGFADRHSSAVPGSKGGLTGELVLWVTVAASGTQATRVLITSIREWSSRERNRKIEISYGDDSLTITGRPDQTQERLVGDFLNRIDSRDRVE